MGVYLERSFELAPRFGGSLLLEQPDTQVQAGFEEPGIESCRLGELLDGVSLATLLAPLNTQGQMGAGVLGIQSHGLGKLLLRLSTPSRRIQGAAEIIMYGCIGRDSDARHG